MVELDVEAGQGVLLASCTEADTAEVPFRFSLDVLGDLQSLRLGRIWLMRDASFDPDCPPPARFLWGKGTHSRRSRLSLMMK